MKVELEDLLTVKEVSPKIGWAVQTIYDKIHKGTFPFPFLKIGASIMFRPTDVEDFLKRRTVKQTA